VVTQQHVVAYNSSIYSSQQHVVAYNISMYRSALHSSRQLVLLADLQHVVAHLVNRKKFFVLVPTLEAHQNILI
jgi:hypothetical protein